MKQNYSQSISYTAVFTPDTEDGGYTVNFPAVSGCFTEGDTFSEAKEMAEDVLKLMLEECLFRDEALPDDFTPPLEAGQLAVKIQIVWEAKR